MGKPDTRQPPLNFSSRKAKQTGTEDGGDDGGAARDLPPPPTEDLKAILFEMRQGFATIADKVDTLSTRMDAVANKLEGHAQRIKEAEERLSVVEDSAAGAQTAIAQMDKLLKVIANKSEDMEARSRRNNIRLIGIPESTNTGRMELYVEKLLMATVGVEKLSNHFIVERAHRALDPRPPPGAAPRPIIARLLNYRDRDVTLQAAREQKQMSYEGVPFSIFPDFTAHVQEERRKFGQVKAKLRAANIDYAMLYPARLRVTHQGQQHFFLKPQHVDKFLSQLKKLEKANQSGDCSSRPGSPRP